MSAMDFFSQTYIAIRGPTGAPQSPLETIAKLADRLGPSTLLSDRRASILALKGLAKDPKLRSDVGDYALRGLLDVLENDAEVDPDTALPVVETLNLLCDPDDDPSMKTLGPKYMDAVLENDRAVHKLLVLASQQAFTPRTATLKLLGVLLKNRRAKTQQYFLTLPTGPALVLAMLDDQREMMRNESLGFWELLIAKNQDIQKLLAFQGAFEKLFNIIESEGGIESRVNAEPALTCVDTLLRFNSANQNYFRESAFPAVLLSLLQFPPDLPPHEPAPQQFALQFWDELKEVNTSLVVGMVGLLASSKTGKTQVTWTAARCLMELALASNAPTRVKTKALNLLPEDFNLPLTQMILTPYVPVPDTNGEEWDRLESSSAFDVLVELILHAEYNGTIAPPRRRDSLELRASALRVFYNFVNNDETKETIVQSMLPREGPSSITPLLHCLITPNNTPLDIAAITSTQFASLVFAHLVRGTPRARDAALQIVPPSGDGPASGGHFFVPADNSGSAPPPPPEDEDEPLPLMQILTEHLSLAFISRPKMQVGDSPTKETREWDRIIINYICLLVQWLWDDPKSVRAYLEAGGLTLLVEPIGQPAEASDNLIPSLCAFLLGTCYEFNREPGEITRATIHQIITRLGVDTLTAKIGSVKEDVRFKEIEPESFVLEYPTPKEASVDAETEEEAEAWFDWAFLDFWKSNYYTAQRAVAAGPNSSATTTSSAGSSQGIDQETQMLLSSLREVISNQAQEIQALQKSIKDLSVSSKTKDDEITSLKAQAESLKKQVAEGEEKRKESEKEQEDLLVLLDELSMLSDKVVEDNILSARSYQEAQGSVDSGHHTISPPTTTASTFSSLGLGDDTASSATSHSLDAHAVSEAEALCYYAGLPSRPTLLYRTGKKWFPPRGPEAQTRLKELREVFDRPITAVWNHDLGWKVVEVLDAHTIHFTTIDVVRFKMVEVYEPPENREDANGDEETLGIKKPVVDPVTIWIGVFPESTSATAAHNAAKDILALLKSYQITDVDIDFRESFYTREAGPQLLKPVYDLDPLVDVVSPLTPALGLRISTKARPDTGGTMALYLAEGGDSNKLLGLSCRHVLIGSKEANIDYVHHPRRPARDVLLLGKKTFTDLVDSIKFSIGDRDMVVDHWREHIEGYKEREKGTDAVDVGKAEAYRIETQRLVDKAGKAKVALEAFLDRVNKDWKNPKNRVLGHILRSPAIGLGVGEQRFTQDWGIFQIDRAKLGDGFRGNKMDLGTKLTPSRFTLKCFPRGYNNWTFEYPLDRLLPLMGTITDDLMQIPDMWDPDGKPCLLVVKCGNATGTTIGRANGVFSTVRDYFQDMSVNQTSMEWVIMSYDKSGAFSEPGDSGSIIADIRGRIGGMLTGGSSRTMTSSDMTYATPFWWLLERIKANGFPNAHPYVPA